jgi:hypothetical protein
MYHGKIKKLKKIEKIPLIFTLCNALGRGSITCNALGQSNGPLAKVMDPWPFGNIPALGHYHIH